MSRLAGLAAAHGLHAAGGGVRLPAPPTAPAARARGGHQRHHRLMGTAHSLKGQCHEIVFLPYHCIQDIG